jgi:hypothetical protein
MPSVAENTYNKSLTESFFVRVYSGTGASRSFIDYPVRGKEIPIGTGSVLTGQITEQHRQIVLHGYDISIPLATTHYLMIQGKQYAIQGFNRRTHRNKTLGYNVLVKG